MMKQNELCFPQGSGFPALYLKHVYVEYGYPVLFSCYSNEGGLFLVSCHRADGEKKEWVITQATAESIMAMLEDRMTIREPFDVAEQDKYLVSLNASGQYVYERVLLSDIPTEILPTAGCYMDVEQGEFDEEIEELRGLCDYHEIIFVQNWNWFAKSTQFTVQAGMIRWNQKSPVMVSDGYYTPSRSMERVIAL